MHVTVYFFGPLVFSWIWVIVAINSWMWRYNVYVTIITILSLPSAWEFQPAITTGNIINAHCETIRHGLQHIESEQSHCDELRDGSCRPKDNTPAPQTRSQARSPSPTALPPTSSTLKWLPTGNNFNRWVYMRGDYMDMMKVCILVVFEFSSAQYPWPSVVLEAWAAWASLSLLQRDWVQQIRSSCCLGRPWVPNYRCLLWLSRWSFPPW